MEPQEQVAEQTAEQTTQAEPTLEDVYKSVDLSEPKREQQVQQVEQQPQQQQSRQDPAPINVPDPYDTEAHKSYLARLAAGQTTLQQGLQAVGSYLTEMQRREARAKMETDIAKAVEVVNGIVGHPDPEVIEAMIDGKARKDENFKKLWERREQNHSAWNSALRAVGRELQTKLSLKTDPNLMVAQQARKLAQKQMATTSHEDANSELEDRLGKAQGAEFELEWERLKGG